MTIIANLTQSPQQPRISKLLSTSRYCSAFFLASICSIPNANSQDVLADPLFGSQTLQAGFAPDPLRIEVLAGGSMDAQASDASCAGFITQEQPDFRLHYIPDTYALGIFIASDVDTTLIVNTPDGSWQCNDDFSGLLNSNAGVSFDSPLTGQYDIWVGTYHAEDIGAEAQILITEQSESEWANLANSLSNNGLSSNSSSTQSIAANSQTLGNLDSEDRILPNFGFSDSYTFAASSGQTAIIDLSSSQFDTYLLVRTPQGQELSNDDFEGRTDRSLLSIPIAESGEYEVTVSSFLSNETGQYTLSLAIDDDTTRPISRTETGQLSASDEQLESGEYIDIYEFDGRPGHRMQADLRSDHFDTFLMLITPSGAQFENDDMDSISHSFLDMTLDEAGPYKIVVTSFAAGATGQYTLQINHNDSAATPTTHSEIHRLVANQPIEGQLSEEESTLINNKLENTYWFTGTINDTFRIDLNSDDFDTYLRLITPSGEEIENDDFEGSLSSSSISLTLRETGRYRVVVTSYDDSATGLYDLSLFPQSESIIAPSSGRGQIYGIFAGISDYPGSDADLMFTDQDALRARDALINGAGMPAENGILLLNSDATLANFRSAIETIASKSTGQDTFVLFYSGHGDRVVRPSGPNSADPDGLDETIELYDGALLDDELAQLFDTVNAGTTLLVLDSCFSGGFAKDLVSKPGRMGLFSSEEDVTSQVASKFRAGGYLSVFFEEALAGYADLDGNGELTAIELSEYLHDRFRNDVKSSRRDQYVRTSGPQSGYQHLVVDRGGIGPYNILFNHQ